MVEKPLAHRGDAGSIPGLGRAPGEGNGNLLHYSCLGNPMNREAWWVVQSMGRKKVRQGLATKQQQIAQETIPSPANKTRTWCQTRTDRTTQWVINGAMPESEMASWKR